MSEVNVKGLRELQTFLDQLPAKVERNILRGALRAGANVIKPVAQGQIRHVSGELARSLKVRSNARGGTVTASVYTRVFYAPFLEYGTKPHEIKTKNGGALSFGGGFVKSVDHPGARAYPFLRPAMDSQAGAAVIAAAEYARLRLSTKHGLDTADLSFEEA